MAVPLTRAIVLPFSLFSLPPFAASLKLFAAKLDACAAIGLSLAQMPRLFLPRIAPAVAPCRGAFYQLHYLSPQPLQHFQPMKKPSELTNYYTPHNHTFFSYDKVKTTPAVKITDGAVSQGLNTAFGVLNAFWIFEENGNSNSKETTTETNVSICTPPTNGKGSTLLFYSDYATTGQNLCNSGKTKRIRLTANYSHCIRRDVTLSYRISLIWILTAGRSRRVSLKTIRAILVEGLTTYLIASMSREITKTNSPCIENVGKEDIRFENSFTITAHGKGNTDNNGSSHHGSRLYSKKARQ